MNKYYENAEGHLFVDPILANHTGLTEITEEQFNKILSDREAAREPERIAEEAAQAKLKLLNELTVTTGNGNTFDADNVARQDMLSAIEASGTLGLTESNWKLADNTWKLIQLDELKEASALAIQAKGAILAGV